MAAWVGHLYHLLRDLLGIAVGGTAMTVVISPHDRVPVPLKQFDPAWLPDPPRPGGRHGMGLYFHCPAHGKHRTSVYFLEPLDGGIPEEDVPLYFVDNVDPEDLEDAWSSITVRPPDERDPIRAPCGAAFYLLGGAIILSSRGPAEPSP